MILHSLASLYDRLSRDARYQIAPRGMSLQKITFKIVLTPDGRLVDIQDCRVSQAGGAHRPNPVVVLGPTKASGSGFNPCFLWDNASYLLGFNPKGEKPERAAKAFQESRKFHLQVQETLRSARFDAVCAFFREWNPELAGTFPVLAEAGTGFGLFQIQAEAAWVHEDPVIRAWWEHRADETEEVVLGACLVTGEIRPLARLHDKIKGVVGTQGGGGALVGFNEGAFTSYGKEQSYNAPVDRDVAFRYATALNAILDGPMSQRHRLRVGDSTVAFWTERPSVTEDVFAQFAERGSDALTEVEQSQDEVVRGKLKVFLTALRDGRERYAELDDDPDGTRFYMLGLGPNAGRVSVRFFHTCSLADFLDNLRRHHRDIGNVPSPAVGNRRADPEFPPTWLLLRQTVRDAKDIPPLLTGALLRAVLTGAPYPEALFAAVLRRIRADHVINYCRACVLKGYLNRNLEQEVTVSLDPARPDPAYRLGRLFAALEKTQKDALGESLNSSIRDSFYGAASATPGVVFPRLLRTYRHHLAKLETGKRIWRERLVQEILDPLVGFDSHLGLAEQGLFAVGYYHQMRDFYSKREAVDSD